MREYLPLLIIGAVLGVLSVVFFSAYCVIRKQKEAIGFDRNMKDGEIVRRLVKYAKPHVRAFLFVGLPLLFSICGRTSPCRCWAGGWLCTPGSSPCP